MSAILAAREAGASLRGTWFRMVLLPWVSVLVFACGSDDSPDAAAMPEVFTGTVDAARLNGRATDRRLRRVAGRVDIGVHWAGLPNCEQRRSCDGCDTSFHRCCSRSR